MSYITHGSFTGKNKGKNLGRQISHNLRKFHCKIRDGPVRTLSTDEGLDVRDQLQLDQPDANRQELVLLVY